MALRIVYRIEALGQSAEEVAESEKSYRTAWDHFVAHGFAMRQICELLDTELDAAASIWNAIDQPVVDAAFSMVIGERERVGKVSLITHVWRRYGLAPTSVPHRMAKDRPSTKSDNQLAWERSGDGRCVGCGTPTIAQRSYDRLLRTVRLHADRFDTTPTYVQFNGVTAPLWKQRIVIAAKGVAEHVTTRSQGGRTAPENLVNACAGCNYSRNVMDMDVAGVAAYRHARP